MSLAPAQHESLPHRLRELAAIFLKIGCIAFGGPPAHIAMMEDEIVSRRRWLSREDLLDFLGAANLLPGPTSTEMSIYIGRIRGGLPGLIVAGSCFILPACFMVTALAWAYVRYGSLPQITGILYGVKPVVIALIAQAVYKLARTAIKSWMLAVVGIAAVLAFARGV
jgi:chromate transporter